MLRGHSIIRLLTGVFLLLFLFCSQACPHSGEGRTVIVGGPSNFPPYSYLDPTSGKPMGFHVDLARAVAEAAGISIEIHLGPWSHIRQELLDGEVDVIQAMAYTPERDALYDFSPHHTIVNYAVFARKDSPTIHSLEDLSGKRIIVNKGDVSHDYLVNKGIAIAPDTAENQVEALRLVSGGRYDFTLASQLSGLYWVKKLGLSNITTVAEPFGEQRFCFAVKEGNEALLSRFSEGLAIVKSSGRYRVLYDKWLSGSEPRKISVDSLVLYGILLLALAVIIASLITLWFWTLRKQVRMRTSELRQEIAEHQSTERALRESEERFRLIFDTTGAGMNTFNVHGRFIQVNPRLCSMLGYSEQELLQKTVEEITAPEDLELTRSFYREVFAGDLKSFDYEKRFLRKTGEVVWAHVTVAWTFDAEGKPATAVAMVQDITDRKLAEELLRQSEERFRTAVSNAPIILWAVDRNGQFTLAEGKGLASLGMKPEQVVGKTVQDIFADVHPLETYLEKALSGEAFSSKNEIQGRAYEILWSPKRDNGGEIVGIIGVSTDITERHLAEKRLRENQERLNYLSYYDPLTQLPNRLLLHDRLQHAMEKSRRSGKQVVLLFLDIDRFKTVNDSMGHALGDRVLCEVAIRLAEHVRHSDTLSRFGGDEFVILLEEINDLHDISAIVQKIQFSLAQNLQIEDLNVYPTASIGISHYPGNGEDGGSLLKAAEIAMYRAKELGSNHYQFYTQDMDTHAREKLVLEADLRAALEQNELILHYQPQIELSTGALVGTEALVRWQRPQGQMVSPGDFIPLAEETGMIVPLGEWVLREACRQNKAWQQKGLTAVPVSVNISALQFRQRDLVELVSRVLRETGLDARFLRLEITESMIMGDVNASIAILQELDRMGILCAIDDFGTGYSSLSYLKKFPISALKIDKSFVRDVTSDTNDASIAISIIALARSMKLSVVAEGIETEEQLAFLRENGCENGQGYLFSRPVPPQDIEPHL